MEASQISQMRKSQLKTKNIEKDFQIAKKELIRLSSRTKFNKQKSERLLKREEKLKKEKEMETKPELRKSKGVLKPIERFQ
jgi:hypothetical protein